MKRREQERAGICRFWTVARFMPGCRLSFSLYERSSEFKHLESNSRFPLFKSGNRYSSERPVCQAHFTRCSGWLVLCRLLHLEHPAATALPSFSGQSVSYGIPNVHRENVYETWNTPANIGIVVTLLWKICLLHFKSDLPA